jgi:hypothetical protein
MTSQLDHEHVSIVLVGRLNVGWLMIDREPDSERRASLEHHWLALLREYEMICDGADHHPEQQADDRFATEVRHGD